MSEGHSRRWFQVSLRSVLFVGIPLAAALAWIISLEGPYFDPQRVCTHKLGLILLLLNVPLSLFLLRAWIHVPQRLEALRSLAIFILVLWLTALAMLAALILRNRQQSMEQQRQRNTPPSASSTSILPP